MRKAARINPETGHNESDEERNQNLASIQINKAQKTSFNSKMKDENAIKLRNENTLKNNIGIKNDNSDNSANLKINVETNKNDTYNKNFSGNKIQSMLPLMSPPKASNKRNTTKNFITPPPSNSNRSRGNYTFPIDLSKTRNQELTSNSTDNLSPKNQPDTKHNHSSNNDTISSEQKRTSSHPKIPLSRTRARPYRIHRSNSAPLSSGKSTLFPTHSRDNSIESFVQSNEIVAIPVRRRSISTHSGEYDNATHNSCKSKSAIKENDKQLQQKHISRHHRDRLGTETSEIITEEREHLESLEENVKMDRNDLGFAMENYLNNALTSEKAGGDIEVEIEPDILRAETPAGVILVNRADPRFSNGIDVESSSILSHSDDLELSSDENDSIKNEINMDQILSGYRSEDDNSISNGSLFDDTIGLDNEAKKNHIYGTKTCTIGEQNLTESLDFKTYSYSPKKKLVYSQINHDYFENKQNSFEYDHISSGSSVLKTESIDNKSKIQRRIRPIRSNFSRSKKNNKNDADSMNQSTSYPIMVDGFDYEKNDPDERRKKRKKTYKNRKRANLNDPQNLNRTNHDDHIDHENQLLMYVPVKKENDSNFYGTIDKFDDRTSTIEHEKDLQAVFRNDFHDQRPQSLPTLLHLRRGEITHHYKRKNGAATSPNASFSENDYRLGNTLLDTIFSSVRSMSTADFDADINDSEKYNECSMLERGRLFFLSTKNFRYFKSFSCEF